MPAALSHIRPPSGPLDTPQLRTIRQQAQELEGVFLNTLVSQMFSGLDARNTFGGGFAEETWRGMQSEQLANEMAATGGIGLADQIMADVLALQEAAQHAPKTLPNGKIPPHGKTLLQGTYR